ncbi:MAG: hypothetical protein P8Z37_13870 [Acidobacteriota bacterium]
MFDCNFSRREIIRDSPFCNERIGTVFKPGNVFCRLVSSISKYLLVITFFGTILYSAELESSTLQAWEQYEKLTEQRITRELGSKEGFLTQDFLPEKDRNKCRSEVAKGSFCILQMWTTTGDDKKIEIPDGLIHHWMGSVRVPNAQLDDLLEWIQDYDQHEKYFSEVIKSRLMNREGNKFKIFYLLEREKFITVHYNTEHSVVYRLRDPEHASSTSRATKIAELEEYGTPEQREKPAGHDSGYMWRLNSYWRFQQKGRDVVISCESISLSRSIPFGLGVLIGKFVESMQDFT